MKRMIFFIAINIILNLGAVLKAQPPEIPAPTKEHQWLEQFAGSWTTESEGTMGPDQQAMKCTGTMESQMLGGYWVVNQMNGDVMGAPMQGMQTIGYDPAKQKYVGTWVDSMTSHLWNYEGTIGDSGKILILEAAGPNFMGDGEMTKYRDAYEFKSADHIIATSSMQDKDGKWTVFMTGNFRRAK